MTRDRVQLLVVGLGVASGALVGLSVCVGMALAAGLAAVFRAPGFLLVFTVSGGAVGAVCGPALAFGLLREVPLWRAALVTSVGAIAGIGLGIVVDRALGGTPLVYPVLLGPIAGMTTAALGLRRRARRSIPQAASAATPVT